MKFWNYAIISVGLALLFQLGGIDVGSHLLNTLGIVPAVGIGIRGSSLWLSIIGIGVIASIIVGGITRTSPENYVIWPIIIASGTLFIAPLLGVVIAAKTLASQWVYYITLFIMAILTTGFVVSLYEHFRGTD
jgi:hypothetical protein|tara:strand:+ start:32 stop:430 length:399 start_codon:yes stop_codon:yes gene_type:complete